MGKRFSDYMNAHLIGQEKAVEAVTSSLVNFWYKGNQQKPLPILLLSQAGGGKSFLARLRIDRNRAVHHGNHHKNQDRCHKARGNDDIEGTGKK